MQPAQFVWVKGQQQATVFPFSLCCKGKGMDDARKEAPEHTCSMAPHSALSSNNRAAGTAWLRG